MQPTVARRDDGSVVIVFITPVLSEILLDIPKILTDNAPPEVRAIWFPDAHEDNADANEEWVRVTHPELFVLFAKAREVIEKDLELLVKTQDDVTGGRLTIPTEHRDAWISGLNAAKLALGAEHEVTADDMADETLLYTDGARSEGILRIHLLAEIQSVLIECAMDELAGDQPPA